MSKRNYFWYFIVILVLLALVTLFKWWFTVAVFPLWIGGIIGIFLPEVDHLIYAYFLRPHEYDSQRMQRMISQGNIVQSVQMGTETRSNKNSLIFHNLTFHFIFALFALFVVSSTGSLLGRGLVLGFLVNLLVDQYFDYKQQGNLNNWFSQVNMSLTQDQSKLFLIFQVLILFLLGVFF